MRICLFIPVLFTFFFWGCVSTKFPYQPYLNRDIDTAYFETAVEKIPGQELKIQNYRIHNTEIKNAGFEEDVRQLGLILSAKSFLIYKTNFKSILGNDTDSCTINFLLTEKFKRKGRSAMTSVENLVSSVKGKSFTPQAEPDTSRNSSEAAGTIALNNQTYSFYFSHNFNYDNHNKIFKGWLALNGDTLFSRQFMDTRQDAGNLKKANWYYDYWFELYRNENACAVIQLDNRFSRKIYILKSLSKHEQLACLAYFAAIQNL